MVIERFEAKTLVREGTPGLFSWADVYLNPYQGCSHDCRYCDGKSESYHMHEDFAQRIRVKANAPQLLIEYLKKGHFHGQHDLFSGTSFALSRPPKIILGIGGGVCDAYQPAEQEVGMTRQLLQIALDHGLPVSILTKNRLVLRDLDLLQAINRQSYACCSFTITLADDARQQIFEPNASPSSERFAAIRALRDAGVHSGIYLLPVLPLIGDTAENMQRVYECARQAKAEFVYTGGLTLKPGRNKNEFLQTLEQHFPVFQSVYRDLYGNDDKYGMPDLAQARKMKLARPEHLGYRLGYDVAMPYAARRYVPELRHSANLLVSEFLQAIAYIRGTIIGANGKEAHRLVEAAHALEASPKDIASLVPENTDALPVPAELRMHVEELLEDGTSRYLSQLEEQAYLRLVELEEDSTD